MVHVILFDVATRPVFEIMAFQSLFNNICLFIFGEIQYKGM